jgi:hypothetical protein
MIKPPSKDTCLHLSRYYNEFTGKQFKKLSWMYLFCWGFYDHWVEDWINAKDI